MKGILDRFEGDLAVILVESEKVEFTVPKSNLPTGSQVNTYFDIEKDGPSYKIIKISEATTIAEKQKTINLMAKLRARQTESKYKR
ncbi:hypothetical protein HNQ35_000275 [Cerasibacillus quisquiliarum]|uniref:DUF3006 domain-containing protein n=1 Tax=Cerasibacillus quisquiliarum TaxID=227865 RepID=A0A511UTW7_9BACI|nr:DUF3006 domain-containing protein [Cerasibacillus quisquiliarum]MBB5145086.1 hypothetical protein [Cerasibacillus quisquiliarum]GEN30024.1 hypothetical protein CQU01_02620 [Cerasibacillus quisquiliarum]